MSNVTLWTQPAWNADRWVREFFGPATAGDWAKGDRLGIDPAVEVARDGDDAVIRLDLPGVDADRDVNVEVDKGRLVVRGERLDQHSAAHDEQRRGETSETGSEAGSKAGETRKLSEVRYGSFYRSFRLPGHVAGDAISASYQAGVLTVRVSGAHQGREAQRIAVESK